jgi:hypothetical protein
MRNVCGAHSSLAHWNDNFSGWISGFMLFSRSSQQTHSFKNERRNKHFYYIQQHIGHIKKMNYGAKKFKLDFFSFIKNKKLRK